MSDGIGSIYLAVARDIRYPLLLVNRTEFLRLIHGGRADKRLLKGVPSVRKLVRDFVHARDIEFVTYVVASKLSLPAHWPQTLNNEYNTVLQAHGLFWKAHTSYAAVAFSRFASTRISYVQ